MTDPKHICEECGANARGGTRRRRGVEWVYFCSRCAPPPRSERELYLDHDQAAKLLEVAEAHGGRDRLMVLVGLNLGARASELVAMKKPDFDWSTQRCWIRTLKRKKRPVLPVYLSEELVEILRPLLEEIDRYLFPREGWGHGRAPGGHVSRWWAAKRFKLLATEAGLPERTSIHAMRHYCAIRTLEQSGDLYFTQRQLRHASLRTTERYLHLLPERARELVNRIRPIGGSA